MPQKRNPLFRNNSFGSPLPFLFWLVGQPMNLEVYQDPLASPLALLCGPLWWIFEVIPIPVASLIPLALLPLVGILTPLEVAQKYGHPLVLLLLGGFLLSKAMEKSGAHRRIALLLVHACPKGDKFLLLGFMLATALLSMWISNTATTLMMLPIALAVIQGSEDNRITIPLLRNCLFRQRWRNCHSHRNTSQFGHDRGVPRSWV